MIKIMLKSNICNLDVVAGYALLRMAMYIYTLYSHQPMVLDTSRPYLQPTHTNQWCDIHLTTHFLTRCLENSRHFNMALHGPTWSYMVQPSLGEK